MGDAVLATWVKMAGRRGMFKDDSRIPGGFLQGCRCSNAAKDAPATGAVAPGTGLYTDGERGA